jgi:hypothetical protein
MQAKGDEAGGVVRCPDAENPALFVQLIVVEWIGRQHIGP